MLELKNVSFSVGSADDELEIIDDISLTFDDGKFVVITGPNGGGKSTLAKLIMGIEQPTAGQIIYNGTDITHMSITERAKLGIGYAFQPHLRSRLTQGRSALPWKPWIFGRKDSHLTLATHSGILSS